MLRGTLSVIVDNLFLKKFDTIFIRNRKNYQNIIFFSFIIIFLK